MPLDNGGIVQINLGSYLYLFKLINTQSTLQRSKECVPESALKSLSGILKKAKGYTFLKDEYSSGDGIFKAVLYH